jgi:predicted ribosome-associated RNA-binding protein Tma20
MSSTYLGSSINVSPTIVSSAGEKLENARGIALAVKEGAVVKPAAGAHVIGISLIETDETVEKGTDVDIQVKDIGKWTAGGEIAAGMELAADADGRAVEARAGDFIVGMALSSASSAGTWVKVQIIKAGYKPASGATGEGGKS